MAAWFSSQCCCGGRAHFLAHPLSYHSPLRELGAVTLMDPGPFTWPAAPQWFATSPRAPLQTPISHLV